jgi:hypothetical protein
MNKKNVTLPSADDFDTPPSKEADYYRQFESEKADTAVYGLRAPSQLVVMYMVYFIPIFVVGTAGWITQNWHTSSPSGMLHGNRPPACSCTQVSKQPLPYVLPQESA